ncbi:PilZ domain-containing protein [Thiovibrio sp. JS02]
MSKKKSDTPEIEPWELKEFRPAPPAGRTDAQAMKKIVRKSFREPILEEEQVYAEINGRRYRLIDIGSFGVGIAVPSLDTFASGSVCAMQLHIGDNTIDFHGEITHTSPGEKTGECHCGVKFVDLDKTTEQKLQNFLTTHHAKLFGRAE